MLRPGLPSFGRCVASILFGLFLLTPAASAAQCIEQVEVVNIPEEIERYGGVAGFEANILQWKSESVAALEDIDNLVDDGSRRSPSCGAADQKACEEEEAIDEVAEDFDIAYAKVYHRNAVELYDQLLDALECYAAAS